MYGKDIGSLRILTKTNKSEEAVWLQIGDKGKRWIFGQTTLKLEGSDRYQVRIKMMCILIKSNSFGNQPRRESL